MRDVPKGFNGFSVEPLPPATTLQRFLRRGEHRRELGLSRLRNYLAETPLPAITVPTLRSICDESGLTWDADAASLGTIYAHVANYYASDGTLNDTERAGLDTLHDGLRMPLVEVERQRERVAHDVYRAKLAEALADGELTEVERQTLGVVAESLGLPTPQADRILDEELQKLLSFALNAAIHDRRWSESEEECFHQMCQRLGVTVRHDEKTQAVLNRYRALSRVESGHLPEIAPEIRLARGEVCHTSALATRHEFRVITRGYNYSGLSVRVPIMKGVSWRVGSMGVGRVRQDVLTPLDSGTLYLTNRRLLFDGSKQNNTVALDAITKFTAYTDGLQVEKATGRDQWFINESPDWELFATCLDTALAPLKR